MDPIRKVKAEVKGERLAALSVELRGWCERQTDPMLKFAAEPRFDETMDEATGEMVFTSSLMTYRIKPMKSDTEVISRQYLEFSDSYARLNSLTNPGSLPPFPRLAVNEALFRSRSIPESVQLTIASHGRFGGRAMTLRSEHAVNWRLLDSDLQKIDEAGEFLVTFTPISLEKYLHIDERGPQVICDPRGIFSRENDERILEGCQLSLGGQGRWADTPGIEIANYRCPTPAGSKRQ